MIVISALNTHEYLRFSTCLRIAGGLLSDGYVMKHCSSMGGEYTFYLYHPRSLKSLKVFTRKDEVYVRSFDKLLKVVPIKS